MKQLLLILALICAHSMVKAQSNSLEDNQEYKEKFEIGLQYTTHGTLQSGLQVVGKYRLKDNLWLRGSAGGGIGGGPNGLNRLSWNGVLGIEKRKNINSNLAWYYGAEMGLAVDVFGGFNDPNYQYGYSAAGILGLNYKLSDRIKAMAEIAPGIYNRTLMPNGTFPGNPTLVSQTDFKIPVRIGVTYSF